MKVLVTGSKGQLGYDVIKELDKRGHAAIGVDVGEMDITDETRVKQVITASNVEAVIHCAAYTAVDAAEDNEEICRKINVEGTRNIARVCQEHNLKMLYLSTDYVFDGEGEVPWSPEDERNPLNVYGQTKYEGELAVEELVKQHFIVRISWVFGLNGNNFVKTMLNLGKSRSVANVVCNQFGSPTYTADLAVLLTDMIESEEYGSYHASNEGICSWYEFACEIFKKAGMTVEVTPVDSSAFPVKAKRPKNSRLNKDKLEQKGFHRLPDWQDALERYLQEINWNK